jgi:hypothetical protein
MAALFLLATIAMLWMCILAIMVPIWQSYRVHAIIMAEHHEAVTRAARSAHVKHGDVFARLDDNINSPD